jgi:hypothetical protein
MYILYSILLYFSQLHSDIALYNIYILLISISLHLDLCVLLWIVLATSALLDTTTLLELGTQAFRYTCNNIC